MAWRVCRSRWRGSSSAAGLITAAAVTRSCCRTGPTRLRIGLCLAALGATVVFLLRDPIARLVLADAGQAGNVGWLALGVALAVASGSQGALLNGMRRIGDLARLQIASALVSSALGVGAFLLWGRSALTWYVLSAPLATFALGHYFVARSGAVQAPPTPWQRIVAQWRIMIPFGISFMIGGLVTTGGYLVVRSFVQRELGTENLGYFQAAWAIGMSYLGFVLGAMGTDYYPRLSARISNPAAASSTSKRRWPFCCPRRH